MFPWGKKIATILKVDLHSHLIPRIDDGSSSVEASIKMILSLKKMGYEKIITTPHIHPKFPNSEATIGAGLNTLQKTIQNQSIDVVLEAAAEYYIDENFLHRIEDQEPLLTFGSNFILVECPFLSKPLFFDEVIFKLKAIGYQPILAHPERYQFIGEDISWLKTTRQNKDLLFQVTLSSFAGYYGKKVQKMAEILVKSNLVDFLGSDLHRSDQLKFVEKGMKAKWVKELTRGDQLLNQTLL